MGNSNNPISSTVPSTVVLEGTVELICGLCIECTECSFRTWRNIHDIYSLVGHVVVGGRIDPIGTWRKINGQKVVIRNYGTWRNIKTTKPRFTGRVKWIGPLANLFHFYKSHSRWRGGRRKNYKKNFFSKKVPYWFFNMSLKLQFF